jgi:DNA-binding winged helix-turn-helix (wHTH) protein
MSTPAQFTYEFSRFRFDPEKLLLYHNGQLVNGAAQKTLEVLKAILEADSDVASYDEIIARVWPDDPHGADSLRVNQYVRQIRKIISTYEPDLQLVENIKGRGYRLVVPVMRPDHSGEDRINEDPGVRSTVAPVSAGEKNHSRPVVRGWLVASVLLLGALLVISAAWLWIPDDEVETVRSVLRESQLYESLVLFRDPAAVTDEDLDRYWTSEPPLELNHDRKRIAESLIDLQNEGLHYGDGTKCEQFDIQWINIDKAGEMATARTLEKWFIAIYQSDGTPQKNKTVGPYFVDYILKKVGGRWLIEKSTTARVTRPVPRLIDLEAITQPVGGSEFLVRITGHDLEPSTIFLQLVGPGCPDSKPCKISNVTLLERATLTATALENVPLTLASGDFRVSAHNGESQPSNFLYLNVP